jgi:ABC-type branched-subunit amino acid transport system ATPase component
VSEPLVEVDAVTAGYGAAEILHGVSLVLREGEIVTIIGPNGAGKSTLLKVIMGYLIPTVGAVRLRGKDVTRVRPDRRVAEGIAFVPQLDNVFPSLTVMENLKMGGHLLSRGELAVRLDKVLAEFPVHAGFARRRARTLSGGQRQLLAMGRALMTEPGILLLDEPSAALSPKIAGEIFAKVTEINQSGRAILIVEQEAQRSLEISHRGYVLVDGRNAFEDHAKAILANDRIRAAFLGRSEAAGA